MMILQKFTAVVLAMATLIASIQLGGSTVHAQEDLKDSGISYTESVETISNPGAGYTTTNWYVLKPGEVNVVSPSGSLVLFFIDIGAYSSGINGVADYDLDESFFTSLQQTFENCRDNGSMIALRFRYDANGVADPEPASFDKVLDHIAQIKDSGILEEFSDILCFVESGFVGKWGEQHGGKYTSVDYKVQLLDAMLDCVPQEIPVTVRTPDTFAAWAGITRAELADITEIYETNPDAKRVGLYDDGYMGSDSDLGTYVDREIETTWLGNQTLTTYFGGEFSGSIDYAQQFDTYLPQNAIPEMYKTHLSYINQNIFQLYKDYTFGAEYDVSGVDNSAYYGQTVFQFIRDHIGYRYVLRKSELSSEVQQGETVTFDFCVENTGFAGAIKEQDAYILLEKDGAFLKADVDLDPNAWLSCTTTDETITLNLPDSIPTGEWNVYLKITEGVNAVDQMNCRSVQFANDGVWNSAMGANYIGSFCVTESSIHGTDNEIYQISESEEKIVGSSDMYTLGDKVYVDGQISYDREWSEGTFLAESDTAKLYLTADDQYLYVRADIPATADAPVYNLQITNPKDDKKYWTYFQSNGFVYFNNDTNDGIVCKWADGVVEFQVPFGSTMNLQPGDIVSSVRVFLQDSDNDWTNLGDVTSSQTEIPTNFNVYSGTQEIRLAENDSKLLRVEDVLENASYQWFHNDTIIENATEKEYEVVAANTTAQGTYSVRITTEDGLEKNVTICNVLEVVLMGDVDRNGVLNLADIVLLQKWLLAVPDTQLADWQAGDFTGDQVLSGLDLSLMRQKLLSDGA